MKGFHKRANWFKILSDEDRALVEDLKAAQTLQGNLDPLKRGHFSSQRVIPLIELEEHNLDCDVCPTLDELLYDRAQTLKTQIEDKSFNPVGLEHKMKGIDMILMAMEVI